MNRARGGLGPWMPGLCAWLLLLTGGLYARALRSHEVPPPNTADLGAIPNLVGEWRGADSRFDPRIYQVLSADTTLMRHYSGDDPNSELWLFVAYFRSQRTGAQIHSPKNCLPGGGWNILSQEPVLLPVGGRSLPVSRFLIGRGAQRQVVYYWFMTRAGIITDEYALKLDLVRNALLRRPTDAAFVRLSGPVLPGGVGASDEVARRFLAGMGVGLARALPFPAKEAF
jgi:EpsI family protein